MNLKTVFHLVTFFLLFTSSPIFAQQQNNIEIKYNGASSKFAIMVADVPHFQAALMTAEGMNVKSNKFSFEIIIVGELAKNIVEDSTLLQDINKSEKLGVTLVMCNNALKFFNVDRKKMDKRIKTTQNGWVYMFELKDKGFNTLSI